MAGLGTTFTNHSIRATSITSMDEAGHESRHIMKICGHHSETFLKHYSHHVSESKKREMAESLSNALGEVDIPSTSAPQLEILPAPQLEILPGPPAPQLLPAPAFKPLPASEPLAMDNVSAPLQALPAPLQALTAPRDDNASAGLNLVVAANREGIRIPVDNDAPVQKTG